MAKVLGDYHLVCPTVLFAQQIAKHSGPNSHFYAYRLMQHLTLPLNSTEYYPWMGVTHGEDSMYIYTIPLHTKPEDHQISEDMRRAWTRFAKTGHPGMMESSNWEEAFEDKVNPLTRHLSLKVHDYKMVNAHFHATCDKLWKEKITQ